jgi:site-specific DNA-methyltransferase (adenine-specific)
MAEKVVIGNAELWHGDCREVLPLLPAHDLLLTDPPYGIGRDGKPPSTSSHGGHKGYEFLGWDTDAPPAWLFGLMHEKAANLIIWGANYYPQYLRPSMGWLVWDKGQRISQSDCELAYSTLDKALRSMTLNRTAIAQDGAVHPTQKPVQVMAWCLDFAADAQTVLDPFMGSGTTGVACAQLGKAFTGIERERKYFDIACERISRAQAQGSLIPLEQTPVAEQQAMDL